MEASERLRLFCAFRLPDPIVDHVLAWQKHELGGLERLRLLSRDHLHITLAFLRHRPASEVEVIRDVLRDVAGSIAGRPVLRVRGYRETARVAMLVLQEEEPWLAQAVAGGIQTRLEELGIYRPERRGWTPHVTVARFRAPPRLSPSLPDLGEIVPSEVALYHSVLRPDGAQYEVLESVALGG